MERNWLPNERPFWRSKPINIEIRGKLRECFLQLEFPPMPRWEGNRIAQIVVASTQEDGFKFPIGAIGALTPGVPTALVELDDTHHEEVEMVWNKLIKGTPEEVLEIRRMFGQGLTLAGSDLTRYAEERYFEEREALDFINIDFLGSAIQIQLKYLPITLNVDSHHEDDITAYEILASLGDMENVKSSVSEPTEDKSTPRRKVTSSCSAHLTDYFVI